MLKRHRGINAPDCRPVHWQGRLLVHRADLYRLRAESLGLPGYQPRWMPFPLPSQGAGRALILPCRLLLNRIW